MRTYVKLVALGMAVVLLVSCSSEKSDRVQLRTDNEVMSETASDGLPAFRIESEVSTPDLKLSVVVRLDAPCDTTTLAKIAAKVSGGRQAKFRRIFIEYYLPEMTTGSGAWATTHFDPALSVRILGMPVVNEEASAPAEIEVTDEIMGRWTDNSLGARYTILRREGQLLLKVTYKDGSAGTTGLDPRMVGGQRRLIKAGSKHDEYLIILKDGRLGLYDELGLISTLPATNR